MSLLFLPSCRECWQGIYMGKRELELEMLRVEGKYTHTHIPSPTPPPRHMLHGPKKLSETLT